MGDFKQADCARGPLASPIRGQSSRDAMNKTLFFFFGRSIFKISLPFVFKTFRIIYIYIFQQFSELTLRLAGSRFTTT